MFDCRNDESLLSAIADIVIEDLHIQGVKRQDNASRAGRSKRAVKPAMQADVLEAIVDDVLDELIAEAAPLPAKPAPHPQKEETLQAAQRCECCVMKPMQCPMRAGTLACNEPVCDDPAVIRFKRLTQRHEQTSLSGMKSNIGANIGADTPLIALSDAQAEILFLRTELARSQLELKRMKSSLRASGNHGESIFALPPADPMAEWLPLETRLAERRFAC